MTANGVVGRQGWWAFGLTTAGVLWSALIVLGAFVVPAYGGSVSDSAGHGGSTSATLVQVNGLGVLVPVGVPLLVAGLVWLVLHRRCSRGGRATVAWMLIGLLWAFAVLTGFSVGLLVVPVAGLLTAGARITPIGPAALLQP